MARIDEIRTLAHREATRLRKAGIRTTEALLRRAATRSGRAELSNGTGIATADLLRWVNFADLMRVKGVGAEYAELLTICGVPTVPELRRRNGMTLTVKMHAVNQKKELVHRLPTQAMVEAWIERAATLDPLVRH